MNYTKLKREIKDTRQQNEKLRNIVLDQNIRIYEQESEIAALKSKVRQAERLLLLNQNRQARKEVCLPGFVLGEN